MSKFVVPHFHFDYLWIDTPDKAGAKTARLIKKGLKRIRRNKNYKFIIDSVMTLKYFRLHYPEMWDELKQRVEEKRVDLIGGMIVAPDTHLPKGETLIRQILYGKKYIKENFGVESNIAYLIDSFGHTAQLPQILRKSGYSYIIFMRGGKDLPQNFVWEGLDGSMIIAHRLNRYYNLTSFRKSGLILKGMDGYLPNHRGKCSLPIDYFNSNPYQTVFSDCVFSLPFVKGELNKDKFEGTYSSRISLKQKIRELENKYYSAELLSTLMGIYPQSMEDIITRILCCCFHDGITGTHTDKANDVMWKMLRKSEKELDSVIDNSLEKLTKNILISNELDHCTVLLVFNPVSVKRTEVATFEFEHSHFALKDKNGKKIPYRKDYFSDNKYIFNAREVPPMGYKIYYIDETDKSDSYPLESKGLEINERENIEAEKNKGDIYLINKKKGKKYKQNFKYAGVVDDGIIRTIYKFKSKIKNSSITEYIIENHTDALKEDIIIELDNKDKNNFIKAVFEKRKDCEITAGIPYGNIKLELGHYPIINWMDMSGIWGGETILTKGLSDLEITKDKIYLTLLRGVGIMSRLRKLLSFPFRIKKAQEIGKHTFEFSVQIHFSDFDPHIEALRYNFPLLIKTFKNGGLKYSEQHSFIEIKPEDVVITSVKKAEEDNDMIVRVLNTTELDRKPIMLFDSDIKSVELVDLLEKPIKTKFFSGNHFFFKIKPHEILTFKVKK